jgi:DNA-binding transcriptional regulator YiaG
MVELQQSKIKGIDISRREEYLSPDEFDHVFGMSKELFATLPKWKRERAKRAAKLF